MLWTFTLSQWFSNLNSCQNHLWDVLKHILLGLFHPQTFCLSTVGIVVGVQLLSSFWLFATPWTAACQASLSFIISWSWLKFMSIELVTPSNNHILCCPLLPCPQSFPASGAGVESKICISNKLPGDAVGNFESYCSSTATLKSPLIRSYCLHLFIGLSI